jgi:hypothetical protein
MGLLERIKSMLGAGEMPEEAARLLTEASDPRDALAKLADARARIQLELEQREDRLVDLGEELEELKETLRAGGMSRAAENRLLRQIDDLQVEESRLERRVAQYRRYRRLLLDIEDGLESILVEPPVSVADLDAASDILDRRREKERMIGLVLDEHQRKDHSAGEESEQKRLDALKRSILQEAVDPESIRERRRQELE